MSVLQQVQREAGSEAPPETSGRADPAGRYST